MGEHALISPSAAHQWINCPPSIRLEQQFQDLESEYAAEGTLAHAVGETLIKRDLKIISPGQAAIQLMDVHAKNKHYTRVLERDAGFYRDYVLERYSAALKRDKSAEIKIETKVDISYVQPGIFGTRDIAIITKDSLEIIDLKYGKGIKVDAVDNPQQALYAIGSLQELPHKVKSVIITIYQPRLNHIDTWETTPEDLYFWADTVAIPAAKKAFEGAGDFKAGHHCQFCNAKPMCRAHYEYNMAIAHDEFVNPELITEEELVEVILKASAFTSWIKAIKDYALTEAKKGKQWKGLKLVAGKADREYKDPEKVASVLMDDYFYSETAIFKKELLSPAQMEMYLGQKLFNKFVSQYVIKPDGAPTLVSLTDKRPALGSAEKAAEEFTDLTDYDDFLR